MVVQRSSFAALAVLAALAACGSGGGGMADDDDDDDGMVIDAAVPDGAADAAIDAPDAPPPLSYCYWECDQVADCPLGMAGTISDADNVACDDGACRWTGCNNDAECRTSLSTQAAVCEMAFGQMVPNCWYTCTTAADCARGPAGGTSDADNFACDGGKCRWLGCNSTAECQTPSGDQICSVRGTSPVPNCWDPCSTASDCASANPAFDADNYVCDDGACVYQGCNSTEECMGWMSDLVCRP
jgi:hypothetical protein